MSSIDILGLAFLAVTDIALLSMFLMVAGSHVLFANSAEYFALGAAKNMSFTLFKRKRVSTMFAFHFNLH